jgi:hypothetical protein
MDQAGYGGDGSRGKGWREARKGIIVSPFSLF